MKCVEVNGQRIAWRDLLKLRSEQNKAQRQAQLTLFELKEDARPASQTTSEGRYKEPTLFKF
jgi:hypothetical protein